ncbi:N-formylglutamate deformylase [Sphingosinithalassobacter sp. LHW66-3]|uniref:N-formylglutamate deformylase n=1 Tax=Sphingosinithalassobacter sp. LHW66-3 TaxID=3424718 RepID=UPI003D6BBB02
MSADWLDITRGDAPLIVSIPHAGIDIPEDIARDLVSVERARRDADLHVDRLYSIAREFGATIVRTAISRTVVDVNRMPDGETLYPGQFTTGLCPAVTFDGEPLYLPGREPDEAEIERRRAAWYQPYHDALRAEVDRLRGGHPRLVLYDAHSIRSLAPKLFTGELPHFNIGTNDGRSCAPGLTQAVEQACDASDFTRVTNGRFKGGWITRHYGWPRAERVHAIQMELAMRTYLDEVPAAEWPPLWDATRAEPCRDVLRRVLAACIDFAGERE